MLPHYQWLNKVYFLTFCTHGRQVLSPGSRNIVLETCLFGNGKLFQLHAAVVMPDHVHLLLTPAIDEQGPISIPEIMQAIKGTSAHRINKCLGRKGRVWQDESFDHWVRNPAELEKMRAYIESNPVTAGLVARPEDWPWSSASHPIE